MKPNRKCADCKVAVLGPPFKDFPVLRCALCAARWLEDRVMGSRPPIVTDPSS